MPRSVIVWPYGECIFTNSRVTFVLVIYECPILSTVFEEFDIVIVILFSQL